MLRSTFHKTPIRARRKPIGALIVLGLFLSDVSSAHPLDEDDVIRLARESSPSAHLARATQRVSEARTKTASPFDNPSVAWEREGLAGQNEDTFALSLPLHMARTLTERSLVAAESAWSRAEASYVLADASLEAVRCYSDVVLAQLRIVTLEAAVADLEEATRVLTEKEAAGTASGYERTRLTVATELARSEVASARGDVEGEKARLAGLLGLESAAIELEEKLEFLSEVQLTTLVQGEMGDPRVNQHVEQARAEAQRAKKQAEWAWLPGAEVKGGLKTVSNTGGTVGYVVGVSLDIPLFDQGQSLKAEAQARVTMTDARHQAYERALKSRRDRALSMFRTARAELERFEKQTVEPVQTMLRAAKSGYREGQRSIVELLDAQRAVLEIEERRIALLGALKRAEIELRAVTGALS